MEKDSLRWYLFCRHCLMQRSTLAVARKKLMVCYDIADKRCRNRVDKVVNGFGVRVQKSVFEYHLQLVEPRQQEQLLLQLILENEISIRFNNLCIKDGTRILVAGTGEITKSWDWDCLVI